jgi:hypothetical protein
MAIGHQNHDGIDGTGQCGWYQIQRVRDEFLEPLWAHPNGH